jgi:formylglycine-generating enzyme required for sulfatase activity
MNESSVWLDLDQITARLCVVTSEQLGLKLEQLKPESRLIEDLNCDSLDLVDEKESVYAEVHQRGETHELQGLPLPVVQQIYGQSRFGLRHMSGTIWHWCCDWFSPDFYRLDA